MSRSWIHGLSRSAKIAGLLVLAALPARAQEAGAGSASFLRIPVGARLMASPDVVAGMRPDASLLYSNPAFLGALDTKELFVSSSQWLDQVSFSSFGAALPLGTHNTLGIGTTLLYSGGLQGYDAATNIVSSESYYDLALDLALAHHFSATGLSVAGGMTYVREHLAGVSDGTGFAFNAGASYWHGRNLFHAAVRDAAGSVSFSSGTWDIASEWMAGAGRVFNSAAGQFFAGMQASTSDAYGKRVRFGVDYAISAAFTIRGGLDDDLDAAQGGTSVNAGLGMRYGAFALEYAYTPQDYFSSSHTFSLAYRFGAHDGPHTGVTVPEGDLAPPVPDVKETPAPGPAALPKAAPSSTVFVLVAGSHATRASAEEEERTLGLLAIRASVESEGPRFRVVIGRFASFDEADRARIKYRAQGHEFLIVAR